MTNSEVRSSIVILLWSCNIICTLSCQLSKSLSDSKEAAGRSEQSQHHSQLGHSGTSAEPLHPDVSGTTAGVFVCLSSLQLNKEENVILTIVFILPFPTAAFPPAAEFADGPKPHSLCRPGYRWSPSAPLVLSSTHCFEVVTPPCCPWDWPLRLHKPERTVAFLRGLSSLGVKHRWQIKWLSRWVIIRRDKLGRPNSLSEIGGHTSLPSPRCDSCSFPKQQIKAAKKHLS